MGLLSVPWGLERSYLRSISSPEPEVTTELVTTDPPSGLICSPRRLEAAPLTLVSSFMSRRTRQAQLRNRFFGIILWLVFGGPLQTTPPTVFSFRTDAGVSRPTCELGHFLSKLRNI